MNTQKEKTKSQTKPRIECRSSAKLRNGVSDKTGTNIPEKEKIDMRIWEAHQEGFNKGYEAGESKAISNFAEKIKILAGKKHKYTTEAFIEEIDKLVEEQSSGEVK